MQNSGPCSFPLREGLALPLSYPVSRVRALEGRAAGSFMVPFPAMPPLFITFEGLDGSGKSTHLRSASAWLEERDIPHVVTHEPGGTPLGDALRAVFLDAQWGTVDGVVELLLVFASRRQHLLEVIDPALRDGKHVLCDRFTCRWRPSTSWTGWRPAAGDRTARSSSISARSRRAPVDTLLRAAAGALRTGWTPKRWSSTSGFAAASWKWPRVIPAFASSLPRGLSRPPRGGSGGPSPICWRERLEPAGGARLRPPRTALPFGDSRRG
jgi:hypothetical protein